jgi:hypothetical protein
VGECGELSLVLRETGMVQKYVDRNYEEESAEREFLDTLATFGPGSVKTANKLHEWASAIGQPVTYGLFEKRVKAKG